MEIFTWANQNETNEHIWEATFDKVDGIVDSIIMSGSPESLIIRKKQIDDRFKLYHWFWVMVCTDPQIIEEHKDWFNINKLGENSADNPPYVGYYRWLCPNNPNVLPYLKDRLKPYLELDVIKGISFDYIRYPDVILPEALQPRYNLIQDCELPHCLKKFKQETGLDATNLLSKNEHQLWADFRENSITSIVNQLSIYAKRHDKEVTASVFPSPTIARSLVRQNWPQWQLDKILPMNYHNFYNKDTGWIGQIVAEGKQSLKDKAIKYYSALYLPALDKDTLKSAIDKSLDSGADGIALFNLFSIKDYHLKVFSKIRG